MEQVDFGFVNHVGCTIANLKLKLKDVPDMNYFHTNNPPQGEICLLLLLSTLPCFFPDAKNLFSSASLSSKGASMDRFFPHTQGILYLSK